MESTFDFGTDTADIAIGVRGVATRAGFERLFRDVPSNPHFRPAMTILLDLWELDVTQLTADDAPAIGRGLANEEARYGGARLAVFAPTASVSGLAQIGDYGGALGLEISVWETYDDAVAWLARDEGRPRRE